MKDKNIKEKWGDLIEKYHIYFRTDNEIWLDTYNEAIKFIIDNNKIPSRITGTEEEHRLGKQIDNNRTLYNKNTIDTKKRKKWKYFIDNYFIDNYLIDKYRVYSRMDNETWNNNYDEVIKFIIDNDKCPQRNSKNIKENQLCQWVDNQKTLYNNEKMNNQDRIKKWKYLIDNYINNNKNKTIECIPKKKN